MAASRTPEQVEQHERLRLLGCMACRHNRSTSLYSVVTSRTELHHILSSGRRMGHDVVVPLCSWHHRGEPTRNMSKSSMTSIYGPSLQWSSKRFREHYGGDLALRDRVLKLLGENDG